MRQRIYLDTSVLSALGDTRAPDRQSLTREFFDRLSEFDACTSDLVRHEVEATPNTHRREAMLAILPRLFMLSITEDARRLSERYLQAGIFPASVPEDALHVAIAVSHGLDAVVSWNFKHLVNQRRRSAVNTLNTGLGLKPIHILAPPEL